ncbi:MAG: FHA domain-containing protein [Polyangiaceae bacterium]|nr:FHA domain-containing protein [Polyangiaceae bacterium]MCE7894226.1 FHA domain-containing protein [Sorangiineae bacterium PRO1]MCL4751432.1 FHA domain-containing protein [Myxococcales bacterium]
MWKLSIEDDQTNKTVVNLVRDEYSIGRGEENTVRLTERNISRRHAKLTRNGTGWIFDDLASYNGCYVNGVRVSEPQKLEHGDLVQVGDYRLEITDEQVSTAAYNKSTAPAVPRAQSLMSQPDRLVMLAGPTPGAEFALAGPRVVIGRGEECEVSVNHASVSRVHAEIQALGDGRYEIVDRESANGLRVNGVDLKRSLLDARDTIELGDVVFKFIPAGQIYHPGADPTTQIGPIGPAMLERHTPAPGVGMERRTAATAGIPPILKAVAGLAFLGVLVMIGMVALGNRQGGAGETGAQANDPTTQVLLDAMQMVQNGDVEGAHNKVIAEIPENSNARQSAEFKDIEARWADMLLDLASREPDLTKKRALLERVAKATSVDSVRRKRANNEIAALDQGVDPSELPSAPKPEGTGTAEPTGTTAPALSGGIVRNDPFAEKPAGTGKTPKKPEIAAPKPKPSATESGPDVKDLAQSGDRAKLTSAKNALKAKAASGKASDSELRMLKALCRQLGDMSCVN